MRPEKNSLQLLDVTRAKAKMFEYGVNLEEHTKILKHRHPSRIFDVSIGILGDLAFQINKASFEGESLDNLDSATVQFSAQFFDSYLKARLNEEINPYLLLVGASSYYLCDLPGSSLVLANQLDEHKIDLESRGIENLLLWILKGEFRDRSPEKNTIYNEYLKKIYESYRNYYSSGEGIDVLLHEIYSLRKATYDFGSDRELLFAEVICAISKKRLRNSVWFSLPEYSNLPLAVWRNSFEKNSFIKELWPAQHMLGKEGIFQGKSGVIKMPTSAGKTRATEIIVRSAFLSSRTSLTVLIAPFRALCHEISTDLQEKFRDEEVRINEITDVLQIDIEIMDLLEQKQIMILTPEKFLYILRHYPELTREIGLVIYDEGHQFDNGTRGITYELLLTSLKLLIPETTQSILVSAVIKNAESVGEWLNGEEGVVISGDNLIPTYRTIALVEWDSNYGNLAFISQDNIEKNDFFVPNVLERHSLDRKSRERKDRFFPDKNDVNSIAVFLGVKLVGQGSVAIFSEKKDSISKMCETLIEAYERGFNFPKPIQASDDDEIRRLHFLYEKNLGNDIVTQVAEIGVLTHHGNIPSGIRISVEYAMREGLAKFLICTSTLAQGVNLPIRYLILSKFNMHPRYRRFKIRDFHNLIGRVGRSGMHTEGSIIFANPEILRSRKNSSSNWEWNQIKKLLDSNNSERITSTLPKIFKPLYNDTATDSVSINMLEIIKNNYNDPSLVDSLIENIALKEGYSFKNLEKQLLSRFKIVSSIESFIMANWEDSFEENESKIENIAKKTLAYFLTQEEAERNEETEHNIIELFKLVAYNLTIKVPNNDKKKNYGTTLYGIDEILNIEDWVHTHVDSIRECRSEEELLSIFWPLLKNNIQNVTFIKFDTPEILKEIAMKWIQGIPFYKIFNDTSEDNIRVGSKYLRMNHILEICNNAFAFEGALLIGSIIKITESEENNISEETIEILKLLQKRLKYGLSSKSEILIYELGFSDRVISSDLASLIDKNTKHKNEIIAEIKEKQVEIIRILDKYPSYFFNVLNNVLN